MFFFLLHCSRFTSLWVCPILEPKNTLKTSSADALVTELRADISGAACINQITDTPKVIERSKTNVSLEAATTSKEVTISSSLSRTPSTRTPRHDGSMALATATALPKCLNCDYRSSQGTDMVEHGTFHILLIVHRLLA